MDLKSIQEPVCFHLGRALYTVSLSKPEHQEYKAWAIVAAGVAGFAVGFFIATRAFLPKPAQLGLLAICTYASARIVADVFTLFSMAAVWLLNASGARGKQLLQTAVQAPTV